MSKPGEADQGVTMFLLLAMGLLALYVVWYFFHQQIIEVIRFVRVGQLYLIGLVSNRINMPDGSTVTPSQLYNWLVSSKADNLSWNQMAIVSTTIVPQFIRWPAVAILLMLAGLSYRYAPRRKLRTTFNLEELIKVQAIAWPVSSPITKLNPATGPQRAPGDTLPERLPIFAEALSPEEFVSYHHIPIENKMIDRETAGRVFMRQLGPRWQGFNKLPPHFQAVAAAFALKGARKRDDADQLLGEIAQCWSPQTGLALSPALRGRIRQLLRDPKIGGEAAKIMSGHCYVIPGMFRLLLWARERGGVLAPATFLWLRAVDRTLWYPLNNAGRRTFHAEAAGAVAHYYAEKFLRRPLIIPKVQGAVEALVDYVKESEMPIPPAAARPNRNKARYSNPRTGKSLTPAGANA